MSAGTQEPALRPMTPMRAARIAQLAALYRRLSPMASLSASVVAARIDALPALTAADAIVIMGSLADKLQQSLVVDAETRDACDAMDTAALALGATS